MGAGSELAGRRAVVTGAARGIGAAIARELAAAGATVALCDVDADAVAAVADDVGGGALGLRCDVADPGDVARFADRVRGELGGIDVLVNNAGVLATAKVVDTTDEAWDRVLAVNLGGTFRMTRAALPAMLDGGWGRVVNLASITPIRGEARTAAYAASKGGVIGFTKALSREVAHRGVTANCIAPGYMLTDQTAEVFTGELGDAIVGQITVRAFGRAEDVAGAARYLASDAARYVTGHVLVVDGGVV